METKVVKIGGSCLNSPEDIKRIASIINSEDNYVLVVSAFKNVTNLIEEWFDNKNESSLEELEFLFESIFVQLFPCNDFRVEVLVFEEIIRMHENGISREHAQTLGEKVSSFIIYKYLREKGEVDVEMPLNDPLIFGDPNEFHLENSSKSILDFYKNRKSKHVLTQGFASINAEGLLSNLRREGSDLTAVIWAHTLQAECILCKDVGAIYTADPHKDQNAQKIAEINFRDYKERFYNSKVIQDRVIDFCIKQKLPLSIYSFKDNSLGTRIIN